MKYQIIRCDSAGHTPLFVKFDDYESARKFADDLPRHESTYFGVVPARSGFLDFIDNARWEPTGWVEKGLICCAIAAFFLALGVLTWMVMNLR